MKLKRHRGVAVFAGWLICSGLMMVQAQEVTPREEELLKTLQTLQERVEALEERLESAPEEESPMEARMEKVESTLAQEQEESANDFRVYWKDGLRLETQDQDVQLRIGGRIHNDWYWFDESRNLDRAFTNVDDGVLFRRARLYMSGEVGAHLKFKAQYDFAGGDADFKDVYMELTDMPGVGNIRLGQFKAPFGLEELTSSNNITFIERSQPTGVFAASRETGMMLHNAFLNDRMTGALGVFRDSNAYGNHARDGQYNIAGRVTGLPWYADEGRQLMHLGIAYNYRKLDGEYRVNVRPSARLTPRFLDTGLIFADNEQRLGLEAAGLYGPFSLQGEYMMSEVDTTFLGNRTVDGWYLSGSWVMTGENRSYKTSSGVFGSVKPRNNFKLRGEDRGFGAWELALRYAELDLNDGGRRGIQGGSEDTLTVGLNWYLNPNARIMFNYMHTSVDRDFYYSANDWVFRAKGLDLNAFSTRFQVNF